MQRHPGQGNWDDGGKDVSLMIQWLQANISKYKGDPERMFIWAHSAGNGPLGTYIGRPELYGPKGVGVKGVVFMSGQFNIAPLTPESAGGRGSAALGSPAAAGPAPLGSDLSVGPKGWSGWRQVARRSQVGLPGQAHQVGLVGRAVAVQSIPRHSWRDPACPSSRRRTSSCFSPRRSSIPASADP